MTPEIGLLFAILERAICDATGNIARIRTSSRQVLVRRAKTWLNSNEECPFSFLEICAHLEINPVKIRRYVLACNEPDVGIHGTPYALRRILSPSPEDDDIVALSRTARTSKKDGMS